MSDEQMKDELRRLQVIYRFMDLAREALYAASTLHPEADTRVYIDPCGELAYQVTVLRDDVYKRLGVLNKAIYGEERSE